MPRIGTWTSWGLWMPRQAPLTGVIFFVSGAVRGTDGLVVGISTEKSGCFFLFRVALGLPGDLWLRRSLNPLFEKMSSATFQVRPWAVWIGSQCTRPPWTATWSENDQKNLGIGEGSEIHWQVITWLLEQVDGSSNFFFGLTIFQRAVSWAGLQRFWKFLDWYTPEN